MTDACCSFCGESTVYLFPGRLCVACTSKNARIRLDAMPPPPSAQLVAFDVSVGQMQAAARRTEMASESVSRHKRASGASLSEYMKAAPLALTPEGQREALALGLVHYKTSDTALKTGRLSIEIDPLLQRAQRMRKSVITSARLHDQEAKKGSRRGAWYMVTLTYRDGSRSGPRDVSELLKRMRGHFNRTVARLRRLAGQVFRYLWVGELTQRGWPHYHLLVWVPQGMWFGRVDTRGWWPHGSSKFELARNAVGYMAKYASKFTNITAGEFPKGFRTHGCGGLNEESRRELRWWKSPISARDALGTEADIRKCQGGYFDKLTGEFWPSPWRVTFAFGRTIAWKVIPL
ncbi:replication initiation protein [Stenotrophomonas rhizophila]|nr:replication initiation protein [Stenotrophomonas rhizophila]